MASASTAQSEWVKAFNNPELNSNNDTVPDEKLWIFCFSENYEEIRKGQKEGCSDIYYAVTGEEGRFVTNRHFFSVADFVTAREQDETLKIVKISNLDRAHWSHTAIN